MKDRVWDGRIRISSEFFLQGEDVLAALTLFTPPCQSEVLRASCSIETTSGTFLRNLNLAIEGFQFSRIPRSRPQAPPK